MSRSQMARPIPTATHKRFSRSDKFPVDTLPQMRQSQQMTNNFTLVRVTKAVVRRLKVAAPMLGKGQQEVADSLLTQAMDARQIPMPLPLGKREASK